MKIKFTLNGQDSEPEVDSSLRLLDLLRDVIGFCGTKEGCGEGECGACSVMMNGQIVNSCLVPVSQVDGSMVETIEGIRETRAGKLIIQCFKEAHSAQCGFCTPGMVVAGLALLRENPNPDEHAIRTGISGNICRCTGYDMIVDGLLLAAKRASQEGFSWK